MIKNIATFNKCKLNSLEMLKVLIKVLDKTNQINYNEYKL